jgi:MFS family permease
MGTAICVFLCYGAFFSWFTVGPVLLIHVVGISPSEFGLTFFVGAAIACLLGSILNARCVERFGIARMMRCGWLIMALAALSMLVLYELLGVGYWVIVLPAFVFYFGSTFIWPGATALALTPFGKSAGYAASGYAFLQQIGGAAFAGLVAMIPDVNQLPLALILLFVPLLAWVIFEVVVQRAVHDAQG